MEWVNRVSSRTAMLFAVCCLLVPVGVAHAADKPQLTGSWNFNPQESDNAQQKIQQAQQTQQTVQRGGPPQGGYPGGGYPGGSYPGGGGGLPGNGVPVGGGYPGGGNYPVPSGGSRGGLGNGSEISSQEWAQLAANPKFLNITQHDDQIVITDSDHTRILYPDGKKHQTKDESGQKISTKTEWQGGELISETRTWSGKLTEKFRLSPDGKQLTVASRFESASLSAPLIIQRVYDLGGSAR
jgi:hypothetical protein